MKKIIVGLMVFIFVFSLVNFCQARGTVRKKVVKIQPSGIQQFETRKKVEKIEPEPIEKFSEPFQPAKSPEETGSADSLSKEKEYRLSGPFVGLAGGVASPGWALGLGLGTTLVSNIMDKVDLNARLGLGYAAGNGVQAWVSGLEGIICFRGLASSNMPLAFVLVGGIFYPVSMNDNRSGELGYNILAGVDYNVTQMSQIGLEVGYGDFKYKENNAAKSSKGIIARVGYKLFL